MKQLVQAITTWFKKPFTNKASLNGHIDEKIKKMDSQIDEVKQAIHDESKRSVRKLTAVQRQLQELEALVVHR